MADGYRGTEPEVRFGFSVQTAAQHFGRQLEGEMGDKESPKKID